jgi:hypothetical protein
MEYEGILFHNINGIKDAHNWYQINTTMKELNMACYGFAEINTSMKGYLFHKWNDITRKTFRVSRAIASESDVPTETEYKPGGTITVMVDKWQARITKMGSDERGLGQWTYIIISSNKHKLVIMTAYKPCKTTGPNTAWTQQWLLLRETQIEPDPITEFNKDLHKCLEEWRKQKYEILLMIDANEEIGEQPGGLGQIVAKNGLYDILANRFDTENAPNTYMRGSKRIDYIFGTERVLQNCKSCGILPFCYGYASDHRATFVRIDIQTILSTSIQAAESLATRLIMSATPREREKFLVELDSHYEAQNLYERLHRLWDTPTDEWDETKEEEFNKCDDQHILGMISAEKKTCKIKTHAWSPRYCNAVENKNFWKIMLTMKRNHVRPDQKTRAWAAALGHHDATALSTSQLNSKLREAQKQLREVLKAATELRETHLRELIQITQDGGDEKQHEKRLRILLRAHKKQYAYRKIQHILKPKHHSGLSHILVPADSTPDNFPEDIENATTWKMIHEHTAMQKYLIHRNRKHFSQAHGTPFTIPPLNKLSWGADDECAEEMIQGQMPAALETNNPYTQAILQYIVNRKQLPDIDVFISPEEIARGFKRWKETTSTSPSGCHLGLRRIPAIPSDDKELEKVRQQILHVQTHIINIPIHNGFSPNRWQTVINAMLEKIQGKPLLHKLRVIHILEADYNLILKVIFGKRLMQNCEKYGTLGNFQDGFRKGRSTTRTLLHNEIISDYNKRLRIDNFIGMTDISGCFDRIIPSITSLLNRKNGCPVTAVQMHAETLRKAKYHLKTKQGISVEFYSNESTPIYGNGQGAGDSPSQWSQESALLFDLYEQARPGAKMSSSSGMTLAEIPIAAFADDTNLFGNNDDGTKNRAELIQEAKQAFSTWDRLLHATGHFLELGKCACYLSIWDFQEDGYAYTLAPEEHGQEIIVTDIHGKEQKIPQLPTNKTQKLLGVMKSPIGDQQDEIARLLAKSNSYARRINSNYLTRAEARLAYEAFYIPAMRYSLNITSINQIDMENIQAKATSAFLAAQGFNRHMPREVVYAPTRFQGVGMRHLYDLQGTDSTRLLLQELNQDGSTTQLMLIALIDAIQLEAGIGSPILEDCRPIDYIEWGWIPAIRDFLQHINGKIVLGHRKEPTYRVNDSYLMDSAYVQGLTRRERIYINRCRIYQQVTLLSDISTVAGLHIHKAWRSPTTEKPSRSTLRWPRQNQPSRVAWIAWEKFLDSYQSENGKLRKPLGPWTGENPNREHKAHISMGTEILWIKQHDQTYNGYPKQAQNRRHMAYHPYHVISAIELPPFAAPVDVLQSSELVIKTSNPPTRTHKAAATTQSKAWHTESPKEWSHIVGNITLTQTDETIAQLIMPKAKFEFASDGGYDPSTGISTFGWVATINKVIIAKSHGPAQAHPRLAESFRAEGYGIASVGLFIRNLIRRFGIETQSHKWILYVDNKSMIQRQRGYEQNIQTSRWNLRPDEDIAKLAGQLLSKVPIMIQHIKSHQDSKTKSENLSFEAHLNILADKEATRQRENMDSPETEVLNIGIAQLKIDTMAITRDSQRWLMQTAGKLPIEQYYKQRHGWSQTIFNSISWDTQLAVLRQYRQEDQTRIIKFVHGWLPTQNRKHREGAATSPNCKLCAALCENNIHLFQCAHPAMRNLHEKIQIHIAGSTNDQGNSELNSLIDLGLQESTDRPSWTPDMKHISTDLMEAIGEQNMIGWQHLYCGRISQKIIKFMDQHFQQLPVNHLKYTGERWARQLIKTIWDTMLQLWKERNEQINQVDKKTQADMQRQILEKRITRCFEYSKNLTATERRRWFSEPRTELMKSDPRHLEAWVRTVEQIIRITKRESKKRPPESKILEKYLNVSNSTTTQTTQQTSTTTTKPRRFTQELNPD